MRYNMAKAAPYSLIKAQSYLKYSKISKNIIRLHFSNMDKLFLIKDCSGEDMN